MPPDKPGQSGSGSERTCETCRHQSSDRCMLCRHHPLHGDPRQFDGWAAKPADHFCEGCLYWSQTPAGHHVCAHALSPHIGKVTAASAYCEQHRPRVPEETDQPIPYTVTDRAMLVGLVQSIMIAHVAGQGDDLNDALVELERFLGPQPGATWGNAFDFVMRTHPECAGCERLRAQRDKLRHGLQLLAAKVDAVLEEVAGG